MGATERMIPELTLAEEHQQAARRRLEQAARSVFISKGYVGATVSDIVAEAGVSRGTLYLHYKTKVELLSAVAADLLAESVTAIARLADVLVDGTREDLHAWISEAAEWYERHRPLALAAQEAELSGDSGPGGTVNWTAQLRNAASRWINCWPAGRREEAALRLELCRLQLQHYMWGFAPLIAEGTNIADILTDMWWRELHLTAE